MNRLKSTYNKLKPEDRMHQLDIPIIGLTGGIASGKSSAAKILKNKGFSIISADELIKEIYAKPESIEFVKNNFPNAIENGDIHFVSLRKIAFANDKNISKLENYLYPQMPKAFKASLAKFDSPQFVIYDVPLLFEKGLNQQVDISVTVYCPKEIQKQRLICRDHIEAKLADKIISGQMDIEQKKQLSDFVIDNSLEFEDLQQNVDIFINEVIST